MMVRKDGSFDGRQAKTLLSKGFFFNFSVLEKRLKKACWLEKSR